MLESFAMLVPGDVLPLALLFDIVVPWAIVAFHLPTMFRNRSLVGISISRGVASDVIVLTQGIGALLTAIGLRAGVTIIATSLVVVFPLAMAVTWQLLTHQSDAVSATRRRA